MTVKELKEQLDKFPDDLPVALHRNYNGEFIYEIGPFLIKRTLYENDYSHLIDEEESDITDTICKGEYLCIEP